MPELPEAETIVAGLSPHLVGLRVARVFLHRSDIVQAGRSQLKRALCGRTVLNIRRRGKRIALSFSPHGLLVVALGMTGRLTLAAVDDPVVKHTHLRLLFKDNPHELRFQDPRRFGGLWFFNRIPFGVEPTPLRLGAEPLTIKLSDFRQLMVRRRQIKALLLDQHALAGLGNIYCDEALHRARIHPQVRAADLTERETAALWRAIRYVLRSAIRHGGSTIRDFQSPDGQSGGFQTRHRVYGRQGCRCASCETTIERLIVAGRSTHLCPACQQASP